MTKPGPITGGVRPPSLTTGYASPEMKAAAEHLDSILDGPSNIERLADTYLSAVIQAPPNMNTRELCRHGVRAILTAMRDPSEEMQDAGGWKVTHYDPDHGDADHTASLVWQAMIDRLLSD